MKYVITAYSEVIRELVTLVHWADESWVKAAQHVPRSFIWKEKAK